MDNKMDLGMFRELVLSDTFQDISSDLEKFDTKNCTFYYDESNNIRKLWLNDTDFNAPMDNDFVLGGVMHFGDKTSADVDMLKSKLRLQKSAKEIKFKHISKAKTFLECLNEDKVLYFLQWINDSDLYIHYSNVNNLYYAIIDIIDSIDERSFIPFHFVMKNELYKIAHKHYHDFCALLIRYNYPNIDAKDIVPFYNHILNYINNDYFDLTFELEILRQGLKSACRQNELSFLQGNPDKTILDNYFIFYARPIGLFPQAKHVFDNEYKVEEIFEKYKFYNGNTKIDNYHFVNSINTPLVQVSDCVVGLLGKYYSFINSLDIWQAYRLFENISQKQRNTLQLFAKIIMKSESLSKLLLNSVESIEERAIGGFILQNSQ